MKHIDVSWITDPHQLISIRWEVDGFSGSTECPAWRGQHEIEYLEDAGCTIVEVVPA